MILFIDIIETKEYFRCRVHRQQPSSIAKKNRVYLKAPSRNDKLLQSDEFIGPILSPNKLA